jgi:hypothetical protein
MIYFIQELKIRNETLFYYGLVCLLASFAFLILTRMTSTQVYNVSAWYKPFKFAFSTFLYAWAMAWYCAYLKDFNNGFFNWAIIILLGFEIIYIAIQAGRGQLSHYNRSNGFYAGMYSLMALAATLVTVFTAYVGILFFVNDFPDLPNHYLWGIRLGIAIFVIFSFERCASIAAHIHLRKGLPIQIIMFASGHGENLGAKRVVYVCAQNQSLPHGG